MLRHSTLHSTRHLSHVISASVAAASLSSFSNLQHQRYYLTRSHSAARHLLPHALSRSPTLLSRTSLHQQLQYQQFSARVDRNIPLSQSKRNLIPPAAAASSLQNPLPSQLPQLNTDLPLSSPQPENEASTFASAFPSITGCRWFVIPTTAADAYARLRFVFVDTCTLGAVGALTALCISGPTFVYGMSGGVSIDPTDLTIAFNTLVIPAITLSYIGATRRLAKKWPHKFSLTLFNGQLTSGQQKPRSRWIRNISTFLVGSFLFGAAVWLTVSCKDTDRSDEPAYVLEILLDAPNSWKKLSITSVGIIGPISEEILFRALFFARLAIVIGIVPAALLSSGIFGLVHGPDKALMAALPGTVLSFMYVATGSLHLPCFFHIANNAFSVALQANNNPISDDDNLAVALLLPFGWSAPQYEEAMRRFSLKLRNMTKYIGWLHRYYGFDVTDALLTDDLQSLKPDVAAHVRSIFRMATTDSQEFLTAEQFAYLASLEESQFKEVLSVTGIVSRRTNPIALSKLTEEQRSQLLAKLEPKNIGFMRMPHELTATSSFGVAPLPPSAASISTSSYESPLPNSFVPSTSSTYAYLHDAIALDKLKKMSIVGLPLPDEYRTLTTPLQHTTVHRWYTRHFETAYCRLFHREAVIALQQSTLQEASDRVEFELEMNGCTADAFEAYVARRTLLDPKETSEWLSRLTQIMTKEIEHPVSVLYLARSKSPTEAALHRD